MRFLLIVFLVLLAGCTAGRRLPPAPLPHALTRTDSLLLAAGLPSVGKLVFRGPVTIQVAGAGATQTASTADNRKAGQRQGSNASAGHDAAASNASKRTGGPPWQVYAGAAVLLVLLGAGGCFYLMK